MLVENILGNLKDFHIKDRTIDTVDIEWYEVNKKILKKNSKLGKEIGIRLIAPCKLNDGDIFYFDENEIVVVNIPESEAILIKPKDIHDMGRICYEIGNKHVALFLHHDEIFVPYEEPLMRLLDKQGFEPKKVKAKLINGLEHHEH